jgi:SAM-dependent methyltransferase
MWYIESEIGPTEKFLKTSWDINASRRHDQLASGIDVSFSHFLAPELVEILKGKAGFGDFRLLDVGCGTGVLSKLLSKLVSQVVGVDSSCESIRIASDYCRDERNIHFVCSAIEDYGSRSHIKFDFIIAHMVLHTIPPDHLKEALERIHYLLAKTGTFVFSIPHPVFYPLLKEETFGLENSRFRYSIPSFYRHTFTISHDRDPLPSKTPYFHRPINYYSEALEVAGFVMKRIHEPSPSEEVKSLYPKEKRVDHPYFMIVECEKCDKQSNSCQKGALQ